MKIKKKIALVAHDHKKKEMLNFVKENIDILSKHYLLGTGTTARVISENTNLKVEELISGPFGGDQQVGSMIAQSMIDVLIFFWDPLEALVHDPDVKALLRIAVLYDIIVVMNPATASLVIRSDKFDEELKRDEKINEILELNAKRKIEL